MKYKNRISLISLSILSLAVLWPLWFIVTQAITHPSELAQTIGTVFTMGERQGVLPLIPTYPTLAPIVELLLDSPSFFQCSGIVAGSPFPK